MKRSKKHLVLKQGFLIDGLKVVPCHYKVVQTDNMWKEVSDDILVLTEDGIVRIIDAFKNKVFDTNQQALEVLRAKHKRRVTSCEENVAYYQKELKKLEGVCA